MTDMSELKKEIADLGSKLEAFLSAQDPPVPSDEQPEIDAIHLEVKAISNRIPATTAKRPFAKPVEAKPAAVSGTPGIVPPVSTGNKPDADSHLAGHL